MSTPQNFEEFMTQWSSAHGEVSLSPIVIWWLKISYSVAGITKSAMSVSWLGFFFGALTWVMAENLAGIFFLILSLIADGLDGSVAIRHGRATRTGALVDGLFDRIVEIFWALAFIKIGAPVWLVALSWIAAATQEYLRARMAGVGASTIHIVTVAERPVRASFLCVALICNVLNIPFVTWIAATWCALQVFSLFSVLRDAYVRLG